MDSTGLLPDIVSSSEKNDDTISLSLMDRRRDNVAVMRMAPINTDLNVTPPQVLDSAYYEAFRKRSRQFFKTSLDMGSSFSSEVPSVDIVGSSSAIKKILMEPYAAGPLSLICHKVGKTVYLDDHIFTKKVGVNLRNMDFPGHGDPGGVSGRDQLLRATPPVALLALNRK
ncbi:hypothetical protein Y032_0219g2455 [Ancylostoma ceylanicum]|uniref:Uncharacterized protein n=1 Tax=Ancylostoma ceylanicum TaxID=53326 RepID=A0A016SIE7_9BILA|nr:hypothetical protein Y032_0219g2455 [Ancylostoma ceylanicum]